MTGDTAENSALPGGRLREQRERRGLTLVQVGSELHIDQRLLAALEDDDYAALGAPIFVKGHLRNYARLLGLDPAELVAEYEAAQQPADPALVMSRSDGPRMDEHRSRAWVGWFGWLFLLVLVVLLAGWWYYQQEGGSNFTLSNMPETVPLPADDAGRNVEAPIVREEVAVSPDTTMVAPVEGTVAADDDTPTGNEPVVTPVEQQPESSGQQPSIQETPPVISRPTTTRPAPAAGRNGLVLEVTEESWVEIYDAEGRPILYDLMAAGSRREINATGQLRLFVGNTEGVELYIGGERFNIDRYRRQDSTARFSVNVPAN